MYSLHNPAILELPFVEWEVFHYIKANPIRCKWCGVRAPSTRIFNFHFMRDHQDQILDITSSHLRDDQGNEKSSQYLESIVLSTYLEATSNVLH